MMACYLSTAAFPTRDLRKVLTTKIGRIGLELSSGLDPIEDPFALLQAAGDRRFLVHNYFPPTVEPFVLNLASVDAVIHTRSVQLCRTAIDLCRELGAPFYSVHAGFAMHMAPDDLGRPARQRQLGPAAFFDRDAAYQTFVATVRDLAEYARRQGLMLLIENNVAALNNLDSFGTCPLLLAEVDELERFFQDIDHSQVRLLLDVGHAKVSARTFGISPESYFERLGPWIEALHLSDNDGKSDTNLPFDASAWFFPYLAGCRGRTMVIEVTSQPLSRLQLLAGQLEPFLV
ncbi:sugar phosphate isomerase/epimerase [Desulfuromonas sp. TF]|uniref:sugar phosphate isomerase/epimerase family protein n=1 Tax=Desulfuromonas sp. TF TaxID=1232410 RepID=UPI000488B686|nr:TIM barrel protein [Desulfuromonas sp. TF]